MKNLTAILAILAITTVPGCSKGPADPDLSVTAFTYLALSGDGVQILTGSLLLSVSDSDSISGYWNIERTDGSDHGIEVGPQIGHGQLVGTLDENDLYIDLNPDWADANVLLQGTWSGKRITGTWTYHSFTGSTASGRFTLTPR